MMRPNVSCLACGWIHFEISLAEAEKFVMDGNEHRQRLEGKMGIPYRKATIDDYKKCFRCGGSHENFDIVDEDNIKIGVTIQPILARSET